MCYRLTLLSALIVVGLAGLTGAIRFSVFPPAPTLPLPPNVRDAAAEQTFQRAAAAMAPDRLGGLEMKLWHKVALPNLAYEAKGRYLAGPGQRFRLEMQTTQGDAVSTRLAVCDGTAIWEGTRTGGAAWDPVTKIDLAPVVAGLGDSEDGAFLRRDFLHGSRFSGITPLLRNLQARIDWVKLEKVERAGRERLRLTGVWKADFVRYVTAEQPWPAGLPEQCRLELDPSTLWPCRLEWWGPFTEGAADTLLAQLEFRNPVIHAELSPKRCTKEFTFDPGDGAVMNQTDWVRAEYKAKLAAAGSR